MAGLNVRSVLVTGSNHGIGLELIRQLAGKSNRPEFIFATCQDPDGQGAQELRNLADKYQGLEIIQLDVCEPASIKTAAASVAELLKGTGLNLLINNAGIVNLKSTLELGTQEDMLEVYKTNVIGAMLVSQAFLLLLKKAAQENPQKGMSCSKAAIISMISIGGSITTMFLWPKLEIISYHCNKLTDIDSDEDNSGIQPRQQPVMEELLPSTVLVTGSNRGIGLELVKQLIRKTSPPKKIFATCRNPDGPHAQELKNLADKHQGIEVIQLDVSEPASIKAAAARVTEQLKGAGLNLLINNAGIVNVESTLDLETTEEMLNVYKTNAIGPMLVSQAFLPLLKKAAQENPQKGMSCSKAAIINMTSIGGSITTMYFWPKIEIISYRCSKAALNMLTKCQSLGYAKDEILFVPLHPGLLQTDMGNLTGQLSMKVEEGVQKILDTLSRLSEKDSGTFVDLDGKVLPW